MAGKFDGFFAEEEQKLDAGTPDVAPAEPVAPVEEPTKFDSFFQEEEERQQLRGSLESGTRSNPDQAAEAQDLGAKQKLPATMVERNLEEIRRRQKVREAAEMVGADSPATHGFLLNRENAAIAHDDVENMTALESVVRQIGQNVYDLEVAARDVVDRYSEMATAATIAGNPALLARTNRPGALAGQMVKDSSLGSHLTDLMQTAMEVVGLRDKGGPKVSDTRKIDLGGKEITTWEEFKESPFKNVAPFILEKGLVSLPEMGLAMASPWAYAQVKAGDIGGERAENDGRTEPTFGDIIDAMPYAAVVSMLERLGARGMFGLDDKLARATILEGLKATGKAAFKEGVLTEFPQEMVEAVGGRIGTKKHREEGMDWASVVEAGIQGAIVGTGVGGSIRAGTAIVEGANKSQQAKMNVRVLEALGDTAQASKVRERLPAKYREFVEGVLAKGDVDSVYIDKNAFDQFMQSENFDPLTFDNIEDMDAALEESAASGNPVKIPLADYITYVAATDAHAELANDIKFQDGPDDMTFNEAVAFDNNVRNMLEDEYEVALESERRSEAMVSESEAVYLNAYDQIVAAGTVPEQARLQASMIRSTFDNFVARGRGDTAREYVGGLNIRGSIPEGVRAPVDGLDMLLERARRGVTEEQKGLFGRSLQDLARDVGIAGDRGDIATAEPDADLKPFQRRMLRDDGVSIEEFIEAASENGYFPGLEGAELQAAVMDGLTGQDVFVPGVGDQNEISRRRAARDLIDVLDRMGIDINADNETIRAALEEGSRPTGEEVFQPGTPAFDQWFRDSKVVDENGNPLVLYHGTKGDVMEFDFGSSGASDPGLVGASVYLTPSPEQAGTFAQSEQYGDGDAPNVMPLYVSIQNPARVVDGVLPDGRSLTEAHPNGITPESAAALNEELKEQGFDGAMFFLGDDLTQVAAFDPEQIKSVNNLGTFDPSDPRILFQSEREVGNDLLNDVGESKSVGPESLVTDEGDYKVFQADFRSSFSGKSLRYMRYIDGRPVGVLQIGTNGPRSKAAKIQMVWVEPEFRRQHIAAELLERARKDYKVSHSKDLTNDGRAFAQADGVFYQADPLYSAVERRLQDGPVSLGTLKDEGNDQAIVLEALMHRSGLSVQDLTNILKGVSLISETESFVGGEALTTMLSHVRSVIADEPQVLDSIINLVPVDMVNDLFGSKGAAKVALHDEAVLEDGSAFDAELTIPGALGNTADPVLLLVGEAARRATELVDVSFGAGWVAPESSAATVASQFVLRRQDSSSGPRASISFDDRGTFTQTTITLFKNKDTSSFLHEAGHLFVRMLHDAAAYDDQAGADLAKMMDFVGTSTMEGFNGVEAQELLARSFEVYLREGKAPSVELQGAFSRFRAWLLNIYKTLRGEYDIELTDEMRGVFDRLLATDEQITEAEAINNFVTAEGVANLMTDKGRQAYAEAGQRATDAARDALEKQKIKEETREATKVWQDEYKAMYDRILSGLDDQPVYQAMDALRSRDNDMKLDRAAVFDLIGEAEASVLPKQLWGGKDAARGMHPDLVAEIYGFGSGHELLLALADAESTKGKRRDLAKQMATDAMGDRHGSLADNQADAAAAAAEAVMNDERGRFLAMELRAISTRSGKEPTPAAVAKEAAKRILAGKKASEVTDGRYTSAALKAGRDATRAVLANEYPAAHDAKMRQILNFYLAREARSMKDKIDRQRTELSGYQRRSINPKNIHPDFIKQLKALLEGFDFGQRIGEEKRDRMSSDTLKIWMKGMENKEAADSEDVAFPGLRFAMPPELERALTKDWWGDMTAEELQGLHDLAKSMVVQGRRYSDFKKAQQKQITDEVVGEIESNTVKIHKSQDPAQTRIKGWMDGKLHFARQLMAESRYISSLSEELDGGQPLGPVKRHLYQRVKRADDVYIDRTMRAGRELNEIFDSYSGREKRHLFTKYHIPSIGHPMTHAARLAFALNMGNGDRELGTGNVGAMREEYTDQQINDVLATLTDKDWDVVEAVWKHIDQYWPEIAALEERTTGVRPAKVEAVPFKTPHGREVRGGYYPLVADPTFGILGKKDMEERNSLAGLKGGGHAKPSTKHGSTIERKGFGTDRKVFLDLSVIFSHVDGVLKDIELREAIVDAHSIINNRRFQKAVSEAKGAEFHDAYNAWIENVISFNRPPMASMEKFTQWMRAGVTITEMGASLRTVFMQPFGLTQSIAFLGHKSVAQGMGEYMAGLKPNGTNTAVQKVMEASAMMRNRVATFNRDTRDAQRLMGMTGMRDGIVAKSFKGIQMLDMAVSVPTWLGAYRKATGELNMSEADAVDYADEAVVRSQGTGLPRDMADISQGQAWKRVFTMFYSFFSSYHNMQTDEIKRFQRRGGFKSGDAMARWAASQVYLVLIPALVVEALFNGMPPEEDRDDPMAWVAWTGKGLGMYALSGIVGFRAIANTIASGYNYQLSPVANVPSAGANLIAQAKQGELDAAAVKAGLLTASYLTHLPGGRAGARFADVAMDDGGPDADEFEFWWRALVMGKEKD